MMRSIPAAAGLLAAATLLTLNGCDPPSRTTPVGNASFADLLAEGDKALAAGRTEDALAAFDDAVQKDPTSAPARQRRGQAYLCLNKFDKAVDDCTAAARINPKLADAYFTRGQAERKLGEANKALDDLSKALDQSPDRADILAARGAVCQQLADTDADRDSARNMLSSAMKDLDKALKLKPRDAASLVRRAEIYLDQGDHLAAIDDCNAALGFDPKFTAAQLVRARAYIDKGEIDKALADCDAAVAADGKRPEAFAVRAKARVERSCEMRSLGQIADCDAAADDCCQALALTGKAQGDAEELRRAKIWSAAVHELRGIIYDGAAASRKAFDEYSTAVSIDPKLADALVRRALNRAKGSDFVGAMNDCNAAIAIDNARPEGYYGRGMINHAQRQYDDAVKDLEEAVARRYFKAYGGLARTYSALAAETHAKAASLAQAAGPREREEYRRAVDAEFQYRQKTIDCASKALQSNPHQPQMYLIRGLAYLNSGREGPGSADFDAALHEDPLGVLAYYYRGIYHANLHRWAEAIADFSKAIELQPNAVLAYGRRARAYQSAGNEALAAIDIQRYRELLEEIKKKQGADPDEENFDRSGKGIEAAIGAPLQPVVKARKELEKKLDATTVK